MKVEQFIIDMRTEHDWIESVLPLEFRSTRDVLRIRIELRQDFADMTVAIAQLLPVSAHGKNGWLCLSETVLSIDDITMDFEDTTQGAKISFQTDAFKASFICLGTECATESPKHNQGEFTLTDAGAHFTPTEVILSKPESCAATLELSDSPIGQIILAQKTSFDRYPRCGCCGEKEEDFPLSIV